MSAPDVGAVKHTPGPWVANNQHAGPTVWRVESDASGYPNDGWCVADALHGPEAEANARLIAAAPDLLEALLGVVAVADRATTEFDAARAIIRRATALQDPDR